MIGLRQFLEWYLGIPAADAGEGTRWRLWLEPPAGLPSALVTAALISAIVAVLAASIVGSRRVSRRGRAFLMLLRAGAILIVIGGLFQASLAIERTNLPWLAILIDHSASMAREDVVTETGRKSRLRAVQDWIGREAENPVAQLRNGYRVRLFEFASDVREIDLGSRPFADSDLRDSLRNMMPDGTQTRLASSLRSVLAEFQGAPPAAVLVLTDGASTEGTSEQLSAAAADARGKSVPLWTVGVGSDSGSPDVEVAEVLVDSVALVDETLSFDVQLQTTNLGQSAVDVSLLSSQGDVLDSVSSPPNESGARSVTLRTRPDSEGTFTYVIDAESLPQETQRENNHREVTVHVRNRKVRVLYVERLPRWEFRHLKAALERDAAVELRTVLLDSDLDYIREDRTALAQPPSTAEELQEYDAVILGDVDPGEFPPGFLLGLRELIGKRAGGLVLIAGPRFQTTAWTGSPLEPLLPVHPGSVGLSPESMAAPHAASVTSAGREHVLFRVVGQDEPSMAALSWWAPAADLKAGAVSLLEVDVGAGSHSPIVVTQRFGNGIVLWHGTDEFWKLRRLQEDAVYGRYWSQAIRWASRGRLAGESLAGELRSDRRIYSAGETVRLELRLGEHVAMDPAVAPTIEIRPPQGPSVELVTSRDSEGDRRFRASFAPARAGEYQIRWMNSPAGEGPVEARFVVDAGNMERPGSPLARTDLEIAATISHGRFLNWQDADEVLRQLPPGRPIPTTEPLIRPLWNRWELAALFAVIVCLEWFVRRRNSLV